MTTTTSNILTWPWLLALIVGSAFAAILITVGLTVLRNRKRKASTKQDTIWVANSAYVHDLPTFKKQLRTYRTLQALGATSLAIAIGSAGMLAAAPATVKVTDPRMANRDIVLCLDVSGSMLAYDRELVDVFSRLVDSFVGERIALSIFNTTSRVVFPLTDDYGMVKEQLDEAYDALDPRALSGDSSAFSRYEYFVSGASVDIEAGSSLIGDGLANCALQFAETDGSKPSAESLTSTDDTDARARSIIFASDNDLQGQPLYTLNEAALLATDLNTSLIGIYGAGSTDLEGEEEFRKVFTDFKGMYFYSDDSTMIDSIVADIQSRQAVEHDAAPVITKTNIAGPWYVLLVLALFGFFAVQWRLSE